MINDFAPRGGNKEPAVHRDVTMELEQYPEDKTEKDLEEHVAPAIRGHMRDLLRCMANRSKPVATIEQLQSAVHRLSRESLPATAAAA